MVKTVKKQGSKKSTRKKIDSLEKKEGSIIVKFLETLNLVKLYHWKTRSYAIHKATDELYTKLNLHIDSFVEVLLGKQGNRINLMTRKTISLKDFNSVEEFKNEMIKFKIFLIDLNNNQVLKSMRNTDLFNIRDEILSSVNQFLYLLTFK